VTDQLNPRCEWHERSVAVAWLRYHTMPAKPVGLCAKCLPQVERNPLLVGRASLIDADGEREL